MHHPIAFMFGSKERFSARIDGTAQDGGWQPF